MNAGIQQLLIALLGICSPFLVAFLIVLILSPRYKALAERKGWTVQPHPEDQRDHVFKGQEDGIPWEMELYVYEHYRDLSPKHIPFTNVIVWTSKTIRLPHHALLIYPRRDTLLHVVHPRLAVESHLAIPAHQQHQQLETDLFALPERRTGPIEFQERFCLRTDWADLPEDLLSRLQYEISSWQATQFIGPVVSMNYNGLTLWWIPVGMQNEWLEKTVRLGTNLARALRSAENLPPQILCHIIQS